jgi:exosortase
VALAALIVAYLPLLALQVCLTWEHPHYRFIPFVPLGAGVLAARAGARLGLLTPGPARLVAWLLGGAWVLLAGTCVLGSAWLGTIAAMLAALVVMYALGGGRLLRALLPAWGLLWLAIPPPLRLDDALVTMLQGTATRWSSQVLDLLGVFHLREGNLIRLAGRSLLIEEACSGIHSLFAVLAGTIFLALWARRSIVRGLLLVATAVTWVFLSNILRIVVVVVAAARWQLDLLAGWPHEALGLGVFALALGMTASTDSLVSIGPCLLSMRRAWARQFLMDHEDARASVPPLAPREVQAAPPTRLPDLSRTVLASRPLAAAFGVLILAQPWLIGNQLEDSFLPGSVAASRLLALRAADLPATWGPFQQQGFQTVENGPGHGEGLYFQRWTYRWGPRTVIVSLDGPFQGWRELTNCYQARGWTLPERTAQSGRGGEAALVAARLERPGLKGNLLFSHFDEHRHVLEPALKGGQLGLLSELRAYGWRGLRRRTYQFQLFEQSPAALTQTEREQALAFFQWARTRLAERISRRVAS